MKKIIVLMMLFSITFINRVIADETNDSDESSIIELEIDKIKSDVERSLDFPIIKAVWYSNAKQVGITLYNWDKQKLEKRLNLKTYTNNQCLSCKLLPLCWGPCAQKQLEHPGNIKRFCQLELMEISLEDFVYFAFNNQILRNKIYENK